MGGDKGGTRKGRKNEGKGGGDANVAVPASIGTLGRDMKLKPEKKPAPGKVRWATGGNGPVMPK